MLSGALDNGVNDDAIELVLGAAYRVQLCSDMLHRFVSTKGIEDRAINTSVFESSEVVMPTT